MNTATLAGSLTGAPHEMAARADDALFRKITWRLIPLLFACYVLNYLDRTNVGYAQLQMKDQLGFSDAIFGLGAGIFFVGYALFEIPSNLMLARIGVRATLLRIMALWGLTSAAMMFVSTPTQFYVLRFLIGVFEAGFAPGVLFYLTLWYPSRRRAQVTALFFMAYGAAPIVAGPIAGLTMTYLDGALSLRGWQWLFLLEGLPSVLLGIAAFFWLSNSPADAPWLSGAEKLRVLRTLEEDQAAQGPAGRQTIGSALRDARVWLLGFMSFLIILGSYALAFWQPTMMKAMGLSVLQIGFYSIVPAVVGIASSILVGRHSDRTRERRWHFAVAAVVGALGLSLTTLFMHNPPAAVACLALAAAGIGSAFIILWAVPGSFLSKNAAATGIALISTVGGSAGMVAPMMVGVIKTATGGFGLSLYILSGALVLSALLMLLALPRSALPQAQRGF
ncbi:Sugar phosphate permease [Variovorax sp. CF079]|uniref:MFS transporter n=1 Tax=Variovorax sp. CF079 TaxID=1882774 RepID=UPI00088A60ED|nr:MFS transporter [Variovorax sp. CF079]SDC79009.1 Sugar phosphate permease [Variovorax sp. CF079]